MLFKTLALVLLAGLVGIAAKAHADSISDVQVVDGELTYVVCSSKRTDVKDQNLSRTVFSVEEFASVKPVQEWAPIATKAQEAGMAHVQFVSRTGADEDETMGWVDAKLILPKVACGGAQALKSVVESVFTNPDLATSTAYRFPTAKKPTTDFISGQRKFGAARSGRLHAACDLYRNTNDLVVAVTDGKIARGLYAFYEGTYAIEVVHTGGFVARYGEVTGKSVAGTSTGKAVKAGQTVGYVGKVNSGCCNPMLHFEMYTGKLSGALTQAGTAYMRRRDLEDPTQKLLSWQKTQFP